MSSFLINDNMYNIFSTKLIGTGIIGKLEGYQIIDDNDGDNQGAIKPLELRFVFSRANTPYNVIASIDVKIRTHEQAVLQIVNLQSSNMVIPYISSNITNFKISHTCFSLDNAEFMIPDEMSRDMKSAQLVTIDSWITQSNCTHHSCDIISTTIDGKDYELHVFTFVYTNNGQPRNADFLKIHYVLKSVNGATDIVYHASESLSSVDQIKDFMNKVESFNDDISNHDNYLRSLVWDICKATAKTGKTTTLSDIVTHHDRILLTYAMVFCQNIRR